MVKKKLTPRQSTRGRGPISRLKVPRRNYSVKGLEISSGSGSDSSTSLSDLDLSSSDSEAEGKSTVADLAETIDDGAKRTRKVFEFQDSYVRKKRERLHKWRERQLEQLRAAIRTSIKAKVKDLVKEVNQKMMEVMTLELNLTLKL